jgi:hypothetical protein
MHGQKNIKLIKFEQVIFHVPFDSSISDHYNVSKHQPSVLQYHGTTSQKGELNSTSTKGKKLHDCYILPGIGRWTIYSQQ